jgi:CheY-like chemotaxis protein
LKTILIVDDDEVVRRLLRIMLEDRGYLTLVASEGAEALRLLREARPDLVLVDWNMPGMSGIQFVDTLRKQAKMPVPFIIILSGSDPEEIEKLSQALGASSFLPKPFTREELLEKIESVLK